MSNTVRLHRVVPAPAERVYRASDKSTLHIFVTRTSDSLKLVCVKLACEKLILLKSPRLNFIKDKLRPDKSKWVLKIDLI